MANLRFFPSLRISTLLSDYHSVFKNTQTRAASTVLSRHTVSSPSDSLPPSLGPEWEAVIGLEIHAQISSKAKLFSAAATQYGVSTNTQVSPFDAALPGTLPVLNQRCVEAAATTALALGCTLNSTSYFDRKHYFYADMPAGYQITQQRQPIGVGGEMAYVSGAWGSSYVTLRTARLVQLQLEQDSGKSLHDRQGHVSLIDLNRAGVGLMEIVTAPEFYSADDAACFVRELRDMLMALGTCDGRMQDGNLRVDANVSVRRPGDPLGVRTEVKNLNSVRNMRAAISYEVLRQIEALSSGRSVVNETLSYDAERQVTVSMRDKEKLLDYRFMPEPNLPPLRVYETFDSLPKSISVAQRQNVIILEDLKRKMAKLPVEKRTQLMEVYDLSLLNALFLVRFQLSDLFEEIVCKHDTDPTSTLQFLRNVYKPYLTNNKLSIGEDLIEKCIIADIISIAHDNLISGHSLYVLLEEKIKNPLLSLTEIIEKLNLFLLSDMQCIEDLVDEVLTKNPKMVAAYKRGKKNQLEVIQKRIMKKLSGKADGKTVQNVIKTKLEAW